MKNLFKSILLIAIAATAFVGCAKDAASDNSTPEGKGFHLNITTSDQIVDDADLRSEYDPEIKNIKWSGNEVMQLYVDQVAYKPAVSVQGNKASFPADIASIASPKTITLQGAVPASAVISVDAKDNATMTVSRLKMELITDQNAGTVGTFDPAADILVVKDLAVELTQADIDAKSKTIDNFQFGRPMAISKYSFVISNTAVSTDELVESIQLAITPGSGNDPKYLTGRFYYAPALASVVDKDGNPVRGGAPFYQNQGFNYVKTTYATQPTLGSLMFWTVTAPVTLAPNDVMTYTIETNKNTIVRTVTLKKEMHYTNRQINVATVAIGENECVVTPKQAPPTGETATLSTSEIASAGTGTSYKKFSITSTSGIWTGWGIINAAYIQINSPSTGTRKGCSIASPVFDGAVSNVKINAVNGTSSGRIFYILPADYDANLELTTPIDESKVIAQAATTSANGSVSIALPDGTDASQFKIYTNGAAYVASIEVTYTKDLTPKVVVAEADQTFALTYSDETEHSFNYTVRNAELADVSVVQDLTSEDWLLVDSSTAGTVKFMAGEPNTGAARTATITLALASGNSIPVTVSQAAAPITLAAPANLAATVDGTKVSATWDAVANASNYAWRIATGGADVKNGTATAASVDITGLSASTDYTVYVKAVGDGTSYLTSVESSANISTAAIPALTMSDITVGAPTASSLTANWAAVTNATGYKYKVTKTSDSSEIQAETAVSGTSVTVTGLSPETEYTIAVKAVANGVDYTDSPYKSANGTTEAGSVGEEYSFSIVTADFNTTSYAANNGSHSKPAPWNSSETVSYFTNQIMNQSSVMQWQKTASYLYNVTELGKITSVVVTSATNYLTVYESSTVNTTTTKITPATSGSTYTYTCSGDNGFIKITCGTLSKTSDITINFKK